MVSALGTMAESMKASMSTTKWRVWASTLGQTEGDMRDNICRTKSTERAFTSGQMEKGTKAIGRMVSSMAKEATHCLRLTEQQQSLDTGKRA